MKVTPKNLVVEVPPAPSADALKHFEAKFTHETDCWDVHATQDMEDRGFVLVDVRSKSEFDHGHLPGAVHIPHAEITAERLAGYDADALFVVYCAGPHCNGSTRAAVRLARLGRPVKEMIGGITGWLDNGYALERER